MVDDDLARKMHEALRDLFIALDKTDSRLSVSQITLRHRRGPDRAGEWCTHVRATASLRGTISVDREFAE